MTYDAALKVMGIGYVLSCDDKEHIRSQQPCYGELRKYESTHKGECTQPHNPKPGDLRSPFPSGTPTRLVLPFGQFLRNGYGNPADEFTDTLFREFFNNESPWAAAWGPSFEFFEVEGRIYGIDIKDLTIDPTVLVNGAKTFRTVLSKKDYIQKLVDFGLSFKEAFFLLYVNGGSQDITFGYSMPYAYTCHPDISFRRFFEGRTRDLTGGYLKDRIDYNRTNMGDVFQANTQKNLWTTACQKSDIPAMSYSNNTGKKMTTDLIDKVRQAIQYGLSSETDEELHTPVYEWKTTSGKTNGDIIS